VNIIVVLFSDRVVHREIIKWNVAVILSECVAVGDVLLPCAVQEPGELYQQVTDNNEEKEEETEEEEVEAVCEPFLTFAKFLETNGRFLTDVHCTFDSS
jgi:hypothetical protein